LAVFAGALLRAAVVLSTSNVKINPTAELAFQWVFLTAITHPHRRTLSFANVFHDVKPGIVVRAIDNSITIHEYVSCCIHVAGISGQWLGRAKRRRDILFMASSYAFARYRLPSHDH
jgi:hypothetical protein